ncbi:uncharacterized protein LOC119739220 [Patiria miniata]|uniref:Reverse transcriptase domain-containing protein n=1 Tax=Patiria miniata TaxID=46514 RepID=A0A914B1W9_PATMI|nr:uncharacterized protein LOC119739220 [Patiria miniata]
MAFGHDFLFMYTLNLYMTSKINVCWTDVCMEVSGKIAVKNCQESTLSSRLQLQCCALQLIEQNCNYMIVVDEILTQSLDCIHDKGLTIKQKKSRHHQSLHLTDLDYVDDLALTADHLCDAQDLLTSLENAAAKVGLFLNAKRTEYMTINEESHYPIYTSDGTQLKEVSDFRYLGSYVADSKKDFFTRKGIAWSACNKLHNVRQVPVTSFITSGNQV